MIKNISKPRKYGLTVIVLLIFLALIRGERKLFTINISDSLPRGIYLLKHKNNLKKGDIVLAKVKNDKRTSGINLLKKITAVEGDIIEIKNNELYINNINTNRKLEKYDVEGKPLISKLPKKLTLHKHEYFIEGTHEKSYDSKYFGIVNEEMILNKANKIF